MEATQGHSQSESRKEIWLKAGRRCGEEALFLIQVIIKYSWRTARIIVILLGLSTLFDILVGDVVPPIHPIAANSPERHLAYRFPPIDLWSHWDESKCWDGIQESLQILDRVCPEASAWVREKHAAGDLHWSNEDVNYNACYNVKDQSLTIHRSLFFEDNGTLASVLAHEFRHSRQNFSNFFHATVAATILRRPNKWIVEDDAEYFESKVMLAIFHGRGFDD